MFNKVARIKNGEVFIVSTDTVPGIGGITTDEVKKKIKKFKKINEHKRFAILVASISQAKEFGEWNNKATKLAEQYWPGALTIALDTYAIRMPDSKKLLKLLNKIGPIYMSSANIHNENPVTFSESKILFKNDVKIYLNLTKNRIHLSSTIINAKTNRIIRQGGVKI